jgi:hypothetical protein
MLTIIRDPFDEGESRRIRFDIKDSDGTAPISISSMDVQVFVTGSGEPPIYINNRDGSNTDGLTFIDNGDNTWSVEFLMSPADNAIIDRLVYAKSGYEPHRIRFAIGYNAGADMYYLELDVQVRDLEGIPAPE